MSLEKINLQLEILSKPYSIACEPEAAASIEKAALQLDKRLRHLRDRQKSLSTERAALMVALDLMLELIKRDEPPPETRDLHAKLQALTETLEQALGT